MKSDRAPFPTISQPQFLICCHATNVGFPFLPIGTVAKPSGCWNSPSSRALSAWDNCERRLLPTLASLPATYTQSLPLLLRFKIASTPYFANSEERRIGNGGDSKCRSQQSAS